MFPMFRAVSDVRYIRTRTYDFSFSRTNYYAYTLIYSSSLTLTYPIIKILYKLNMSYLISTPYTILLLQRGYHYQYYIVDNLLLSELDIYFRCIVYVHTHAHKYFLIHNISIYTYVYKVIIYTPNILYIHIHTYA